MFFVLVDDNGRPLTGAEAMALLERSDVLARLREYGYLATGFSAVVPPSESKLGKVNVHSEIQPPIRL